MPSLRQITAKAEAHSPDFYCAWCARRFAKRFLAKVSKGKQRAMCTFCAVIRHERVASNRAP
jgi:CRISPR/Cas system-associated protein Cas10 (large subunit of type III CRISPR-Cas system)